MPLMNKKLITKYSKMRNLVWLVSIFIVIMFTNFSSAQQPIIFSTIMQGNNGVAIDLRIEIVELVFSSNCGQWGGNFNIKYNYEFKAYKNGQPIAYEFWNAHGSTLSIDGFGNAYQIVFPQNIPKGGVKENNRLTVNNQTIYEPYPCNKYNINNIGITALNISFTAPDFNNSNNKITLTPDVVLPIELKNFYIERQGSEVVNIVWTTVTERDLSHFIIEKSNDGRNWDFFESKEGSGNSQIPISYRIRDNSPFLYYRLTSVDFNGDVEVFKVISNKYFHENIKIYPNPFYDELYIKGLKGDIEIYNINGQLVLKKSIEYRDIVLFETMDLEKGIYLLRFGDLTFKLVKY